MWKVSGAFFNYITQLKLLVTYIHEPKCFFVYQALQETLVYKGMIKSVEDLVPT